MVEFPLDAANDRPAPMPAMFSPTGADATEAAAEGRGGASVNPADMEVTDGARE